MSTLTERVSQLVQAKDADGLRRLLLAQAGDTRMLLQTFNYLTLIPSQWLRDVIAGGGGGLNDVWFLVFKRRWPAEVLAAFEYDYYARHTDALRSDPRNEAFVAIDFLLGVHFAGANGPSRQPGIYGKEFFVQLATRFDDDDRPHAMNSSWHDMSQGGRGTALRPSPDEPLAWTVLHVKMRRVAFWLLHEVASAHGNAALSSLMAYATALRAKHWASSSSPPTENQLYNAVHQFFAEGGELIGAEGIYSKDEWDRLVHDVLLRVDREWPTSADQSNDIVLTHFFSLRGGGGDDDDTMTSLPFIYDGTSELQAAFRALVTRAQ